MQRGPCPASWRSPDASNGAPVLIAPGATPVGRLVCTELRDGRAFGALAGAAHTGVRVPGPAALAITQVPLGHAVAAVLDAYHEWDVAGALCLAAEAGAVVLDAQGKPGPAAERRGAGGRPRVGGDGAGVVAGEPVDREVSQNGQRPPKRAASRPSNPAVRPDGTIARISSGTSSTG